MGIISTAQSMDVRRFQSEDLPRVLAFLAVEFPRCPHKADERYFLWRFRDNPLGSSLEDYWLAYQAGRLIGQLGVLRDRVWTLGRWHDALWLVDLMVAPEHRGGLTALRLFQAVMNSGNLLLTTGAGEPLLRLYQTLGWRRMAVADSYYLPMRPGRLANLAAATGRASSGLAMMRPALWLSDRILPTAYRMTAKRSATRQNKLVITLRQNFDADLEPLLAESPTPKQTDCFRSIPYLRWKFDERPVGKHRVWVAQDEQDGALRGYLAAKLMRRDAIASWLEIVDYRISGDHPLAFTALTDAAVSEALALDLDFVRFRLSNPQHQSALVRPWWVRRTLPVSDEVFAYSPDVDILRSLQPSRWQLTSLVSDRADNGCDEWVDDVS